MFAKLPKILTARRTVKKLIKAYASLCKTRYELKDCVNKEVLPYSATRGSCVTGIEVGKRLIDQRISSYLLDKGFERKLDRVNRKLKKIAEKYNQ